MTVKQDLKDHAAKKIRIDAAVSRPTLCIRGCHLVVTLHQRDGMLGKEWYCPRCDASYPFRYWNILKSTRRTEQRGRY